MYLIVYGYYYFLVLDVDKCFICVKKKYYIIYLYYDLVIFRIFFFNIEKKKEFRVVFFGKIGVGKSVIGNIIFGEMLFEFLMFVIFVIKKCLCKFCI